MAETVLRLDDPDAEDPQRTGGKGANLAVMRRAGLPVPAGFVITVGAYEDVAASVGVPHLLDAPGGPRLTAVRSALEHAAPPLELEDRIRFELARLGPGAVAVRSSGTAGDSADARAAGQQETELGVVGGDAVLAAVRRCWASLWSDRAVDYRGRRGGDPHDAAIAVVVQRLVDADAAGVLFTADPVTGRREDTRIAAAWGLGESVVGGSVDTDELVVSTADGAVRSRRTADKRVRTVRGTGGTREEPVPLTVRRAPVLSDDDARALVALGVRAQALFGAPQDVEWAVAGGEPVLLQARPITALPEPAGPAPTSWPVSRRGAAYVRGSIVEQLPAPLSPLFEDLIVPAVTTSIGAALRRLLPGSRVDAASVALETVNGYAYYRYDTAGFGVLLLGGARAVPGLFRGTADAGPRWWETTARPAYAAAVERLTIADPAAAPAADLLAAVRGLVDAAAVHFTAVQTVVPVAATSELVFERYARTVARTPDPPLTMLLGEDSEPLRAELDLRELADAVRERPALARAVAASPSPSLEGVPSGVQEDDWSAFRDEVRAHLGRYGHAVYDLDLAVPLPVEDPAAVVRIVGRHLRGELPDPAARRARVRAERDAAVERARTRLDPARRRVFDRLLAAARRNGPVREDALSAVGLAWPAARRHLAELGARLVAAGAIGAPEDVHWLRADELRADAEALDGGARTIGSRAEAVAARRLEQRGRRLARPPQVLPERSWMRAFTSMLPGSESRRRGVLEGTPGGGGTTTGTARVLRGPEDFGRFADGDVLVAAITTPAWTPLFAVAGGVVTDIGGPLSHSSIVAREYGVPAVLGTGSATARVRDGDTVTVDGWAGTVRFDEPAGTAAGTGRGLRVAASAGVGAAAVGGIAAGVLLRRRR